MKYFIVNTTIRDGEFEYFSQSPYKAKNETNAIKQAARSAKDWTKDTFRDFEISGIKEITYEEYKIISKYIY
jgi:hypothetical protein